MPCIESVAQFDVSDDSVIDDRPYDSKFQATALLGQEIFVPTV